MSLDGWLVIGAAGLLIALLGVWARRSPRRLVAILAIGAAAAAAALLPTDEWLVQRLTILHEGNSERTLQALFGRGHIRDGLVNLWHDASPGQVLPIIAGIRLNLAATVLFVGGLLLAVTEVLRPTRAGMAFLLLLGVSSPLVILPAFSELPSALVNLYFVAALLPARLIARGEATGALRLGSATLLGALAVLMVRARLEMLILVVPGGAVLLAPLLGMAPAAARIENRTVAFCGWLMGHPARLVAAVALCLVAERGVQNVARGHASWAAAAFNPFDLVVFRLPAVIAEASSLGLALLCCLGWFYALKRWRAYAGLSISLLILGRLYLSASHGVDAETFRYLTYIGAALLLLSALGVEQLRLAITARLDGRTLPRAWVAALALLCIPFGGDVDDQFRLLAPAESDAEQREARFLANQLLERRDCTFVAPVADVAGPMVLVLRAGEDRRIVSSLDEASELAPASGCTLLYAGLDCHLVDGLDCSGHAGDVVASEHFVAERYSDNREYGFMTSHITLRLRRLR